MSADLKTEVCVIGGGPSGATVARRLAQMRHRVCLIERERFPRPHIGESLSPGILPLLEVLGIRTQIEEAGFYRPRQTFVQWESPQVLIKDYPGAPGFQVDRGRFDDLLLQAAKESGVQVIQPALAARPFPTKDEKWQIPVRLGNERFYITADFLIDAAGRRSVLGSDKKKYSPDTLALYAYWRNVRLDGTESRVETGEAEWFWGAPLPDGTFNAAVFLDSSRIRKEKVKAVTLKDYYCSLLKKSQLLQACLDGEIDGAVRVCDVSTYLSKTSVTYNSIRVGEASYGIDPLSAQGVQAAIQSGLQASIVVHSLLSESAEKEAAIAFYEQRQQEAVSAHLRHAGKYYFKAMPYRSSDFWSARAFQETEPLEPNHATAPPRSFFMSSRLKFSSDTKMILTPCIVGDIIRLNPALVSASLERPTAFFNEIPAADLWNTFAEGKTVAEALMQSEVRYGSQRLLNVIKWLVSRNILNVLNES